MGRDVRVLAPSLLLFLAFVGSAGAQPRTWRVQRGEALSVIAARFSVTVEQLREWNTLDGDRIVPGQELVVGEPDPALSHTVARGETLSHIAAARNTTVERLLELNEGLDADHLREGQVLRVEALEDRHHIEYTVRRGDNLARIAERHRVEVSDIRRWNPRLRGNQLRAGSMIHIYSEIPESVSESVGRPHHGRLIHAEQLPEHHAGYYLRDPSRAYGTLETILWIQEGVEAVLDRFPDSPQVRIHDISNREGGRMRDHRSHQTGRDVDFSFYQRRCPSGICPSRRIRPEDLDVERQWALFEAWLRSDRVEYILLDYALQQPLYEEARRQGVSRADLARWFQYPRARHDRQGIIRHYPRHRDHVHVRFVCPDTDESCR